MAEAVLLMGADLGDRAGTFDHAMRAIEEHIGPILSTSRDHWTEPWGFVGNGLFLNRAVLLRTALAPAAMMEQILVIERSLGRQRKDDEGYASRPIDIDILLIGNDVIKSTVLEVPHPRLHQRAFALSPAADIVPEWRHPLLKTTVLEMLDEVTQRA